MDFGLYEYLSRYIADIIVPIPFIGSIDITPYLIAAGVFIGLSLLFKFIQVILIARLEAISGRTHTDVDDALIKALKSIRAFVYTFVALYLSLQPFTLPLYLEKGLTIVFLLVVVWQAIEFCTCLIDYGINRFLAKDEDGDGVIDPNAATASDLVTLLSRIVLWVFGAIFILSNLGIEVTSLIAGLGIGGIAVAFALQGILSDLFASFSIYFDRPFRVGDFVIIGTDSGTVEKIGIKSTRIRTLQGEELVVSNAELTTTRVQNFKKMQERRIVMKFGITYETPSEKVKMVTGMVERIFAAIDGARLDRVHFTTFADSALLFEVVYYIESSDYTDYLNRQQQFNFELMDTFAQTGIEFAYPTQTIYTKQIGE